MVASHIRRVTTRTASCKNDKRDNVMAKQVFDFRAGKGMSKAQSNEHQRRWTERAWQSAVHTGNYDRTREHLNFEVTRGGKVQPIDKAYSISELITMNLKARGIKDPNQGMEDPYYRTVVNIILGGSRERMRELAFGNQEVNFEHGADNSDIVRSKEIEKWACDMYRFAADRWGEENIVACYAHMDEKNPHIHLTLLPIDKEQKFAFKRLFAGKDKYEYKQRTAAIHDALAKVNAKWGLDRGDNIVLTGARHRSTEEYRRSLSRECTTLEEQVAINKERLRLLDQEIRMAERRVKGLTTMIQNLENQKASIESEQKRLADELASGRGNTDAIREQIRKHDMQLQSVIEGLADKRAKLDDAVQQRDGILSDVETLKNNRDELRRQVYEAAGQMEEQMRYRLKDAFADTVLSDFRLALPDMSFRDMETFNGTMLADMAADGENIMTCALYLYGGMLDAATDFAKGHGGGGGGNDLPWGRKEDEDDRAWARRCMTMAHRMMKPSGGRRMKR